MISTITVIGIGNELRGDDAAGLHAARRLQARSLPDWLTVLEHQGEAISLLDLWAMTDAVLLVDAVQSGLSAGTLHRHDCAAAPLPAAMRSSSSTHAVPIAQAIELARTLGRLPSTTIIHGVEGHEFRLGRPISADVQAAIGPLVDAVHRDVMQLSRSSNPRPPGPQP